MIGRLEASLRSWRRQFSRSEWLARLLKLSVSTGTESEPGLVMIQIDGLGHDQLQQALRHNKMPFLQSLIDNEHYQLRDQYCGFPSATPAVQGELFYGVKTGVPAFNFMQQKRERLIRMFEPTAAKDVEQQLQQQGGIPLLEGGSCYADNFTGGAAEPHFCPSALGWGKAMREANPLVLILLIISNGYSFLRTAVLMLTETILAVIDFLRGLIAGRNFLAELKFIPTRVFIVILLRELITIGVKIDLARGLPVIHLNLLGYDEQAHRRGPASLFAHWTLQGIDDAIARIWHAAHRSNRRSYDLWIYSDHGQEQVQAYEKVYSKSFSEATAEVFTQHEGRPIICKSSGNRGIQLQRIQMLGGKRLQQFFAWFTNTKNNDVNTISPEQEIGATQLTIAPLGPVAHLYYDRKLCQKELSALAQALVNEVKIPVVFYVSPGTIDTRDRDKSVRVCIPSGEYSLAEAAAQVLGADHPYLKAVCKDLIRVCLHPDAGVLIACGYKPSGQSLSFAIENGAHGGIGASETNAFTLLPGDIPMGSQETKLPREPFRPIDLRNSALKFLGRSTGATDVIKDKQQPAQPIARKKDTLRVMTYNVHSCLGMDGKLSPERIARVIAHYKPDIIALQELDVGRLRSKKIDQAHLIAQFLKMEFHFHAALHVEEERYGNAILSHLPMKLIKSAILPGLTDKPQLEPRGALWVTIDAYGKEFQLINTHLGLYRKERQLQVASLLGSDWLRHPDCLSPVILCGDFNTPPSSREWRQLHQRLPDAQVKLQDHTPQKTFFSRLPSARIDHVFVDETIKLVGIETPRTRLVQVSSDHLPLIVEFNCL